MQLNLSTLENEQIIFCPHYKYHQLQKRLNVPLSMLAVRLDNQRRAGKHAHLPPIEEQTRENSKKKTQVVRRGIQEALTFSFTQRSVFIFLLAVQSKTPGWRFQIGKHF